jgi:phage shock protein PspC (stress-responsive transcriptional regulator)
MKKLLTLKNLIFTLLFLSLTLGLSPQLAYAQQTQPLLADESQAELDKQNQAFIETSGLGTRYSIGSMVSAILKMVLSFLGLLFFLLILYAGFLWMTSAGNDEKIEKAKAIMKGAVIGLLIILMAYVITYFVIDQALEATRGGAGLD